MQSIGRLTVVVCCGWALALLYGEMVAYWLPLFTCSWPHQTMDGRVKVAVLADPQLMDRTSLRLSPGSFLLEAAQFYTDIYMRRSFHGSILPFKPDVVLFLGDLFDGGPFLSDQEWQESLTRFRHIFGLNEPEKVSGIPIYYLSGNHDIGYASIHSLHPEIITRFEKEFGARNFQFSIGKVEFIAIDAQTLDGPKQAHQTSLSWDFIRNISNDVTSYPRVLLSHIPLYRSNGTHCGPFRSSPIINQRISHASPDQVIMYQNYLTKKTSDLLLELIKPVLVLSGHDHDQCTVNHSTSLGFVTEHTLGTLSWQQGNMYPSFMLLSVMSSSPSSNVTNPGSIVSTHLCFLPIQTHIYMWYLVQLVVTLLLFIFWPTNGFGFGNHCMSFVRSVGNSFLSTSLKDKDEEENCEYEMIWDAEGSMHLVKKTSMKDSTAKSDVGLTGGGVVARPSAKKHIIQEQGASVSVDMSAELKVDSTGRSAQLNKSRPRRLIQRLIRVFRLVVIVAAVNIPLYVMLLFKDWI